MVGYLCTKSSVTYSCMSDSVDRIEGISCFLRKILSSVVEVVSLSVVCRRNADCNAGYDIVFCKNPAGLQTACFQLKLCIESILSFLINLDTFVFHNVYSISRPYTQVRGTNICSKQK